MAKGSRRSAGILLYRAANGGIEVLLAHPGGPVWAKRHAGAWSIPKGEIEEGEEPWDVARREFEEETGHPAPDGASIELGVSEEAALNTPQFAGTPLTCVAAVAHAPVSVPISIIST